MGGREGEVGARDLEAGVPLDAFRATGMVAGEVGGEPVVLVRVGGEVLGVDGACTHYGAPLGDGLVVGDTLRCPWHHACFSLRTGEVLAAPALQPLGRWRTRVEGDRVWVEGRRAPARAKVPSVPAASLPGTVAIVGAGAAGSTAARTLREAGYAGAILLIDPDAEAPYDRPNLSKDYLSGDAPAEWLPLWSPDFCVEQGIDRIVSAVERLDLEHRRLHLTDGSTRGYDALLIATGSTPIRPSIPGADGAQVHLLRSLADCRALLAAPGARAVIVGASFIGLEAAASLRARGLDVTVVAPEAVPFARVLGDAVGESLRALHEQHGVRFRLGRTVARIGLDHVELDDNSREAADLVLLGVGVRPVTDLASTLRLETAPGGIEVDARLETRIAGVFAAGDVAWYPDVRTGERLRIEHWVVAQRQGAAAARNILGQGEPFRDVPFFWTRQYDFTLSYVGHAGAWDELVIDGEVERRDCRITYLRDGKVRAVATIGRDLDSLRAELAFERSAPPHARVEA